MPRSAAPARSSWEERFVRPNVESLLAPYSDAARGIADRLLDVFADLAGKPPRIEWMGLPWRWTLVYRGPAADEESGLFLIPTPDWPTVALPVPGDVATELLSSRSSRYLRETLLHACEVGPTRWAEWQVQSRPQLEDILALSASIAAHQTA